MGPILVGLDGSAGAAAALRWAAWMAARTHREVHVAHAWQHGRRLEPLLSAISATPDPEALEENVRTQLRAMVDDELDDGSIVTDCLALRGTIATALCHAAAQHDDTLLVVGARGATGALRVVLGSVCRELTTQPTVAVAVVPDELALPTDDDWSMVVGVDGSTGASRALRWAASMAARGNGRVVAVHALEPPVRDLTGRELASVVAELQQRLDEEWCAPLRTAGVRYTALVEHRAATVALGEVAATEVPACVAVGSRGHGEWSGHLLGSVTYRLVRDLAWPVVVIPGPRDAVIWPG